MNILYVLLCGVVGFWNKLEVSPLDKDISFTVLLPQQNVDASELLAAQLRKTFY